MDDPQPSAQIPYLQGVKLSLAKSLKQGESYYELSLKFDKVIEEAKRMPAWMYGNTKRNLTAQYLALDDTGGIDQMIWRILHTIPRDILCSVVLGTVYYDMRKTRDYPKTYSHASGIGVYAIGIGVRNRQGKWLSANELTKVVKCMERYVKGYEIFKIHRGVPTTSEHKSLHDLVKTVDSQFGNIDYSKGSVKFIEDDTKLIKIRALLGSLKKRAQLSLEKDAAGSTPMIQTPLYIGCSIQLENRMLDHELTRNLSSSNKAYAFTVSVMAALGYSPVSKVVCVTRLWNMNQLSKAEVLVGALASCYITQDCGGFNRVECGDASGASTKKSEQVLQLESRDAQEYVMSRCSFMYENLTASCDEMERRQAYLRGCEALSTLFQPLGETIEDDIMALDADHENLELSIERALVLKQEVDKKCEGLEKIKLDMEEELEMVDLFSRLMCLFKETAADDGADEHNRVYN